jgi:hypothetical protein
VHTRFNLPPLQLLGLLAGLLLLGLALSWQRRADGGVLWGASGLHGGLVGGCCGCDGGSSTKAVATRKAQRRRISENLAVDFQRAGVLLRKANFVIATCDCTL